MTDPMTPLPYRKPMDAGFSAEVASLLTQMWNICNEMRKHEEIVIKLGMERRQTVTRLRDNGIPWQTIADWTIDRKGTGKLSQAALFKHQSRTPKSTESD